MTAQLPSLSNTLDFLSKSGQILFSHEENNMVSFKQGDVTYRTNKAFIDQLETLAKEKQVSVYRCQQIKHGSARRNVSTVTGTILVRLISSL